MSAIEIHEGLYIFSYVLFHNGGNKLNSGVDGLWVTICWQQ